MLTVCKHGSLTEFRTCLDVNGLVVMLTTVGLPLVFDEETIKQESGSSSEGNCPELWLHTVQYTYICLVNVCFHILVKN